MAHVVRSSGIWKGRFSVPTSCGATVRRRRRQDIRNPPVSWELTPRPAHMAPSLSENGRSELNVRSSSGASGVTRSRSAGASAGANDDGDLNVIPAGDARPSS